MVKRWLTLRTSGWKHKAFINGLGAVCCAIVMVVFATTKFREGAWIVVMMVPLMVAGFFKIHHHYRDVARQLTLEDAAPLTKPLRHAVMVLVPGIHKGILPALTHAKTRGDDVQAVFVEIQPNSAKLLQDKWSKWGQGVPLVILKSPWRELQGRILDYIDLVMAEKNLDLMRTLSGFEVWLDSEPAKAERTASGALLYRFATTSPSGEFTIACVEIPAASPDAARRATGPRFADIARFWRALACDALTDTLEEQSVIPDAGHFIVHRLTPAQHEMAQRWTMHCPLPLASP